MAGSFDLKKATDGRFYFNLKAANGEIILTSQMYTAKASAKDGIASVQANSPLDVHFARETSANGKFYFTLNAVNHQVIGNSEMYETAASRDGGIEAVMADGATTVVRDLA